MEMIIIIIIIKILIIIIKPATPFQEHWHGLINVWHLAKSLRKLSNNDRLLSNVGSIFLSLNLDYQKIDERAYCMSPTFFFSYFFLFISASHAVICLNYIILSSSLAIPLLQQDHRDHRLLTTRLYHKTYYLPATTAFFFFWFGCGIWLQPSILQL